MKNKKIGVLKEYKIEVRDAFILIIIVTTVRHAN